MSRVQRSDKSILIVDDVKGQREIATMILEKLNYSVSSVKSGEEAVEYLKEQRVDRSVLEIYPQQKATVVSGFSESDRVKTVQSLVAGAYVKKPYDIEKLGLAIKGRTKSGYMNSEWEEKAIASTWARIKSNMSVPRRKH